MLLHPTSDSNVSQVVVVDDHDLILQATASLITTHYPTLQLSFAQTAQDALEAIAQHCPTTIIIDLSIPESVGEPAQVNTGLKLLSTLMRDYPDLNIMVQSSYTKTLIRMRHEIENHQGGFIVADKVLPREELLRFIQWTMQGITHTKTLKRELEVKPEWLEVLQLAFNEGLQDHIIATRMNRSLRMIRRYWTKIQDVLGVYPGEGQNIRVLTLKRAREEGLID